MQRKLDSAAVSSAPGPERSEIQQQLERMLAHRLFRNSERFPKLLRHLVTRTLEGQRSELKERIIGIEVFGRRPDYDTNADPVVSAMVTVIN